MFMLVFVWSAGSPLVHPGYLAGVGGPAIIQSGHCEKKPTKETQTLKPMCFHMPFVMVTSKPYVFVRKMKETQTP